MTFSKVLPVLFQAVLEGQHLEQALAPVGGGEGHMSLQGEL